MRILRLFPLVTPAVGLSALGILTAEAIAKSLNNFVAVASRAGGFKTR